MLYTYCYVKGEDALKRLLRKMGKDDARFVESFAHVGEITIERIFEKPFPDDWYSEYFILYMKHPKGQMHISDIRRKVHEDVRDGEKGMKKV